VSLVLLTGGARSGKSRLAVDLAARHEGPVVVVATAEALDEEMAVRIRAHKEARPSSWATVEEPIDLGDALEAAPSDAFVLVDCLSLWVANLMGRELPDEEIVARSRASATFAAARRGGTVAVTNEVGSAIVPDNRLARRFRDLLGVVNTDWAAVSTRVGLVVAGRVLPLSTADEIWTKDLGWTAI
jgi:adenosyl cobinamide kinase/adenosyl cobinamide phosphate guanylyltransferase